MRISRRPLVAAVVLGLGAVTCGVLAVTADAAPPGDAAIPFDRTIEGRATYYDDAGYGACGTTIDAAHEMLVAVSHEYWTAANPNTDPLCAGVQVRVTYQGTTITVPVVDKCPSCDATHLDLSKPAFSRFADPDVGVITGLTWMFVKDDGTPASTAAQDSPTQAPGSPSAPPATSSSPSSSQAPGTGTPSQAAGTDSATRAASPGHGRPWAHRHTRTRTGAETPAAGTGPSSPGGSGTGTTAGSGTAAGSTLDVLVTGYGWWDNTPAGSAEISHPVLHRTAGGTGTYADPITVAVPYHCGADGGSCLQWPAGTRFYLPSLQRYLIVEDTCGDGGPDSCPDSTGNHLDVWVGGRTLSHAASDACEERITGRTTAVLDPADGLPVVPGDICR